MSTSCLHKILERWRIPRVSLLLHPVKFTSNKVILSYVWPLQGLFRGRTLPCDWLPPREIVRFVPVLETKTKKELLNANSYPSFDLQGNSTKKIPLQYSRRVQ